MTVSERGASTEAFELTRFELSPPALANLERVSGGREPGRLTVLLSALFWLLRASRGEEGEEVSITVPALAENPIARRLADVALRVDLSRSMRDHVEGVKTALTDALRRRGRREDAALDAFLALGGWDGLPPAVAVSVRYVGEGRGLLQTRAGLGPAYAAWVVSAIDRFLDDLGSPSKPLAEVLVLSRDEAEAIRRMGTGRVEARYLEDSFVEVFRRVARDHPGLPAVISAESTLSYAELDAETDRLAHALRTDYAVEPGQTVGVLLDNGPDSVRAMLAVLKSGAVYVPIDPMSPEDRVACLVETAGASVLITTSDRLLESLAHMRTLAIDLQLDTLADPGVPLPPTSLDGTAYLMFTSGSTGRPKGVRVGRRGLVNMLLDQRDFAGVGPTDRVLQPFSPSFDASVLVIGLALTSGAAVVPVPTEELGRGLPEALQKHGVTIAVMVPTMLRSVEPDDLAGVHTIICGGEALMPADADRYGSGRRIINSYGATETTCCVCAGDVLPGDEVTVGRPVANTSVYLLNGEAELVPLGASGEVCVSGVGVVERYVDSDAVCLAQLPNVPEPVYRTGDIGRWGPDGRLRLIGRRDRQLKLGGWRIEPGEIESVLLSHPWVRTAFVICSSGRLWAFLSAAPPLRGDVLTSFLSERLPPYMVPANVVVLSAIPTGPNGKVDTAALARLTEQRGATVQVGPESASQATVRSICQEVLGQPVEMDDDFFEVGGSSLSALKVLARVEQASGVAVKLSAFFEAPNARSLAAYVEQAGGGCGLSAIPPASERERYELSPAQLGMWLACQRHESRVDHNVARVFALQGRIDAGALSRAVEDLGRRHQALRTIFVVEAGLPRQRVHPQPTARLEIVDPGPDLPAVLDAACSTPFRLDEGPLLRVVLVDGGEAQKLVVVAHHIVCDGWSMSLLLKDLARLYESHAQVRDAPPPPAVSHVSATEWQRAQAGSDAVTAKLEEWRERLEGAPPGPGFRDVVASAPTGPTVDSVAWDLTSEELERLRAFAARRGSSCFMVTLAALAFLLRMESGQEDLLIGSPVSNRSHPDLEDQIGMYLNMLVHRIDTRGATEMTQILERTEASVRWALDRLEVPYVSIAEQASGGRSPSEPMFQVELDYRAATMEADPERWALGGVCAQRMARPRVAGRKFGWDFLFTEGADGLGLEVLFDASRFSRDYAETVAGRLRDVLLDLIGGANRAVPRPPDAAATALERRRERLRRHANVGSDEGHASLVHVRHCPSGESLQSFLGRERDWIDDLPHRGGAVLYRGGDVASAEDFRSALDAMGARLITYTERSSDRREVGSRVYTSTEHPADQTIKLHTEHSYAQRWPLRIIFSCTQPAPTGGETSVASVPAMMERLCAETLERFGAEGIMYVRNFGGGLGLAWPTVFGTHDRYEVEAYCRQNDMECRWSGEGRLQTRVRRPAFRRHPITGQDLWFNHAYFFNVGSLDPDLRSAVADHVPASDLPFLTLYGNGTEIEQEIIDEIDRAYAEVEERVRWQKGDLLILDNMLVAHGRMPFQGQRQVLVAMSNAYPAEEPEQTAPSVLQ